MTHRLMPRRHVSVSPASPNSKAMVTIIGELPPVSGRESDFVTVLSMGAVVVVTTVVVLVATGAMGIPVTAFEAGESPSPFTALIVTE